MAGSFEQVPSGKLRGSRTCPRLVCALAGACSITGFGLPRDRKRRSRTACAARSPADGVQIPAGHPTEAASSTQAHSATREALSATPSQTPSASRVIIRAVSSTEPTPGRLPARRRSCRPLTRPGTPGPGPS